MARTKLSEAVTEVNRAARSLLNAQKKAAGKEGKLPDGKEAEFMVQAQHMAIGLWHATRPACSPGTLGADGSAPVGMGCLGYPQTPKASAAEPEPTGEPKAA